VIDFDDLVNQAEEEETRPDNRAIEETLLVGLLDPTVAPRILEKARPGDFHFDLHRRFADVVFPMAIEGRHIDRVTFRASAGDDDKLLKFADQVAGADRPKPGKVFAYLDIFDQEAKRRSAKAMIDQVGKAFEKGEKAPEAVAGDILKAVADLEATRRLSGSAKTEGEELDAFFADLEARQGGDLDFVGLDTGFSHLNRVINGLNPGLYILAAVPSAGKTTFAKQIADTVVEKHSDVACLFVSLEQSKEELRIKTISRLSGIENRDLQRGRLDVNSEGWGRVVEAKDTFASFAGRLQVLEGDRMTTVDRIRLAALQLRQKTQAGRLLIVVDYLQIIPADDGFGDIRQKVNFVISELRRIGRDLDAPVLAISSINRASYAGQAGKIDVFKESGELEYSADVAFVMVGDKETKGEANYLGVMRSWRRIYLDVVKNRNGERARVALEFYPSVSRFREVSKENLPDD